MDVRQATTDSGLIRNTRSHIRYVVGFRHSSQWRQSDGDSDLEQHVLSAAALENDVTLPGRLIADLQRWDDSAGLVPEVNRDRISRPPTSSNVEPIADSGRVDTDTGDFAERAVGLDYERLRDQVRAVANGGAEYP